MARKKTWLEKLHHSDGLPKVFLPDRPMPAWGEGTCVVPTPLEVDALMKKVTKGKLVTTNDLRAALAKKHGAGFACPITTGIFALIAAHAAEEEAGQGKKRITPYWRTLKAGGEVNPKFPGGVAALTKLLKAEGHRVIRKGKRHVVEGYERKLAKLKV
jgi:hypothetical protein